MSGNKRKKLCNYLESHRCCGEKQRRVWKAGERSVCNFKYEIRKGLTEQVMVKQSMEVAQRPMWYLGEVHFKQRGKQLPSPLGTEMFKVINETGTRMRITSLS